MRSKLILVAAAFLGLALPASAGVMSHPNLTPALMLAPSLSDPSPVYFGSDPAPYHLEDVSCPGAQCWTLRGEFDLAQAETAPAVTPPPPASTAETVEPADTFVDLGPVYRAWAEAILATVGSLLAAFLGWVAYIVKQKFGVDIEARHRESLQAALTNAAGLLVEKGQGVADNIRINVKNERIAEAVEYVLSAAPDAIERFGLSPSSIAEKLLAKAGVIAATGTPTPIVDDKAA